MSLKKDTPVEQVAILCGGRGTRLRPTTNEIPKALVPINGRPIIEYIIDFYRTKGYCDFILCTGYRSEQIKEHFLHSSIDANIIFSDAGESASMLMRLWQLRRHIGERLFVSYCDTFIDLDLDSMLEAHTRRQAEVTLVSAQIRNPFGLLTFDEEGWAQSFEEKPLLNYYIGCFLMENSAFGYITPGMLENPDGKGIVDFFQLLVKKRKLAVFEHSGAQITFNTENERRKAEQYLGQFYTYPEDE